MVRQYAMATQYYYIEVCILYYIDKYFAKNNILNRGYTDILECSIIPVMFPRHLWISRMTSVRTWKTTNPTMSQMSQSGTMDFAEGIRKPRKIITTIITEGTLSHIMVWI